MLRASRTSLFWYFLKSKYPRVVTESSSYSDNLFIFNCTIFTWFLASCCWRGLPSHTAVILMNGITERRKHIFPLTFFAQSEIDVKNADSDLKEESK